MAVSEKTIAETITEIRSALQDYIEAAYHVGHPALVKQRRVLLEEEGIVFRSPYIESTPRYTLGRSFSELELPAAAKTLFSQMAHPQDPATEPLIYDPPYSHQASALEATVRDGLSVVVTTGTGSGKTEAFLFPILARLAVEAQDAPLSFATPSLRAILLYPMNALVNDQLGRLRLLFGDPGVAGLFTAWAGRPARFARYTSRTLYPGVRTTKKDSIRLKSIERFYVSLLERAADLTDRDHERAGQLVANLRRRGKWPAKENLQTWYGPSGQHWKGPDGAFQRAVLMPGDPELLTRHEVLGNPPDVLVTNYSMLEYMLMRPLERPIFDATRNWLAANPDQRLMLVVDEAHLYRGAAGAEVALLLRRLRSRLGVAPERIQVVCTSASFSDTEHARRFAAQLTGQSEEQFRAIQGELELRPDQAKGTEADAVQLAELRLESLYDAIDDPSRVRTIKPFLDYRGVPETEDLGQALYDALHSFPPMSLLVNLTMVGAKPVQELGTEVFSTADKQLADRATTVLIALGSLARRSVGEPGLLPCRVHAFFRGLPGLWACVDDNCPSRLDEFAGSPVGTLYSQPQDVCECGARVYELFTCRNCGSAYARAYTDDVETPRFLWNEPGAGFESVGGRVSELAPIDLLLEEPTLETVEPADLDLVTGRLNPDHLGERVRRVFMPGDRSGGGDDDDSSFEAPRSPGEFRPCGVCNERAGYGRSSVQDHQTKGDQPFQALVTRQIQVQPPSPQVYSDFAPLRGRKVLAFSDSRQMAARLAPNLQTYSLRDALRPLILVGWRELAKVGILEPMLSLEDLYLAVLFGSQILKVRLRPELRGTESFHAMHEVMDAFDRGAIDDPGELLQLVRTVGSEAVPQSLLRGIVATITDRHYGLQSLGLASIRERSNLKSRLMDQLPPIADVAESPDQQISLVRAWIAQWTGPSVGLWFQNMNMSWWQTTRGVRPHSGNFAPIDRWLGTREAKKAFERHWLPVLLDTFCELLAPNKYRIRATNLALEIDGAWGYCQACRTTQRPFPSHARCISCGRERVEIIDPDTDPVFAARKGYYRGSSVRALRDPPERPMAIIAAEHTAQLNAAQSDEVFSKAEEHELLFQDVDIGIPMPGEQLRAAIDVLSCTTTMEVGIDIGTLSGVALRNMPPSRASYQQRSGRAGRRGNAVATVVAFGSSDTHDEHYFAEPDAMIRGRVDDPVLTLDNVEIARRHVIAFLFQKYHEARLPTIEPEDQPQLFEVLGGVADFLKGESPLNRQDFEAWLVAHKRDLVQEVAGWLPDEIASNERAMLLDRLVTDTLMAVDAALTGTSAHGDRDAGATADADSDDAVVVDAQAETGEERSDPLRAREKLLDRLLYKGVLPSYAFPTDVVAFYVFDRDRSTRYRPAYRYAPSQGLSVALTQYAPGKRVWIDGKEWSSGALYSPMSEDRYGAWENRRLYFECSTCHYARTESFSEADRGELRDCPACGATSTFGKAKNWMTPPGFAHPHSLEEETSPDDQPARSYATRAKLVAPGPADRDSWQAVTSRIREHYARTTLLVTNTGPRQEGYTYCTRCGLIAPTALPDITISAPHPKPYPDEREPTCPGARATQGLVLGTDFLSDVLLISMRVDQPLTLRPGLLATEVALRTLSEAFTIASTRQLEIDAGELQAEFRPALTEEGSEGLEAEIYLYDTLAGGAGFARRVADQGVTLFHDTIALLEGCPANCDRSCYRCLRSFKNRFEHGLLDRYLGATLLRFLVLGEEPRLDPGRLEQAADRLFADLTRQGLEGVEFQRNSVVDIPSIGKVTVPILVRSRESELMVGIHSPLTPDHVDDQALHEAKEFGAAIPVLLVDEMVVSRNLPHASRQVIEALS
jgi:ATP-dependent helicase YprA (DUF1998 family)